MRIVEPTLAMFLNELPKLDEYQEQIAVAAGKYLEYKRGPYHGPQHAETKYWRGELERSLDRFKREMSRIYDIMHDRGLANFESALDMPEEFFYPIKPQIELSEFDPEVQLLEQVTLTDPLMNRGFYDYKQTVIERTDREPVSSEGTERQGTEVVRESSADLQSAGNAADSNGNPERIEEDSIQREEPVTTSRTEYVFPE
jgi:hypothetical protein